MTKHTGPILVFLELNHSNTVLPVSLQCLSLAQKLAETTRTKAVALIMGSGIGETAEGLRRYDLDEVYWIEHKDLQYYQPDLYLQAIEGLIREIRPGLILMGHTKMALDLAPRISFAMNIGLIVDCVKIEMESGEMLFTKPVYSGNVIAHYSSATETTLATLRSRSAEIPEPTREEPAPLIAFNFTLDSSKIQTTVIERKWDEEEGIGLEKAEIIVSGGRGIGGPEGFALLKELAEVLGAAVGSSRPPVDCGWISPKSQVGLTGKSVGPKLYIACGISGAMQHLAGMAKSKVVVAINKDPEANIFAVADYGVVGNYQDILPAFQETLKEKIKK